MQTFTGNIVDVAHRRAFYGMLDIEGDRVAAVRELAAPRAGAPTYAPGFVDAHVHIESSMLPPSEFARAAVVRGTVAAVCDPHEIANVLGEDGVRFMCADAARTPFYCHFGVPSCVPATPFETAGAAFDADAVARLFDGQKLGYLSEMMNFPGALFGDANVRAILETARARGKPIDGHSPGLAGADLARYAALGVSTDHECATLEAAQERVKLGMKILVREGSAARNLEALWPLFQTAPDAVMLCHDDLHPDDLQRGMLDVLLARLVAKGVDAFDALRAATWTPVRHYGLPCGLLRAGDRADFVELEDLKDFRVLRTFVAGKCAAQDGACAWPRLSVTSVNRFDAAPRAEADFRVPAQGGRLRVMGALDGQLFTERFEEPPTVKDGVAVADPARDLLKIAVVNRYEKNAPVAVGFVRGFGLKSGALASSVAHDSHNVVAVGADDAALCRAVNLVIAHKGGLAAVSASSSTVLPLPIAGLMSDLPADEAARLYGRLNAAAAALGSPMRAPFMTLAFMALPVIPHLKLTDKGLFDVDAFAPVGLWA